MFWKCVQNCWAIILYDLFQGQKIWWSPSTVERLWISNFSHWGHSFQVYFKKWVGLAVLFNPFNCQSEKGSYTDTYTHPSDIRQQVHFYFCFCKTNTHLLQKEIRTVENMEIWFLNIYLLLSFQEWCLMIPYKAAICTIQLLVVLIPLITLCIFFNPLHFS